MKKMKSGEIRLAIMVLMCALLCACRKMDKDPMTTENSTEAVTETMTEPITEIQEETTMDDKAVEKMNQEIEELLFHNVYCNLYVFSGRNLPPIDDPDAEPDRYLYQVDTSMFRDYADFESYIRSVYVKETADRLLYSYPYEGKTKYVNHEGMLCLDTRYEAIKENYVDWYNYTWEIDYIDDKECGFTVYTTITEPSENPVEEEYSVSGRIIWEDGYWYLEEMLY